MKPTQQHLTSDLHAAWREIDALVVQAMVSADARGEGRERLLKSGLLDPALTILAHARKDHGFKGGTLSVYDAMATRGIIKP